MSNGAGRSLPGFEGLWAICASAVNYENNLKCPHCQSPLLTSGGIFGRCAVASCLTVVDTSRGLIYTQVA